MHPGPPQLGAIRPLRQLGAIHPLRDAISVFKIGLYDGWCRVISRVWTLLRAATVTERGGSTAVTIRVCFAAQMELRDRQAVFPGVHP